MRYVSNNATLVLVKETLCLSLAPVTDTPSIPNER